MSWSVLTQFSFFSSHSFFLGLGEIWSSSSEERASETKCQKQHGAPLLPWLASREKNEINIVEAPITGRARGNMTRGDRRTARACVVVVQPRGLQSGHARLPI